MMIWFFVITSVVFALVGAVFLVAPMQILFLMSDADKGCFMEGRSYPLIARWRNSDDLFMCTSESHFRFALRRFTHDLVRNRPSC